MRKTTSIIVHVASYIALIYGLIIGVSPIATCIVAYLLGMSFSKTVTYTQDETENEETN